MRPLKTLVVGAVVAVGAVGGFELYSPTLAAHDASNAAGDVAFAAAHKLFTERDSGKPFAAVSTDAKTAAVTQAEADNVTLVAFSIDAQERVHVTVAKEAGSVIVARIGSLKHWDERTASAVVAPG